MNDVVVAAAQHADQLTEQAERLDHLLTDTRGTSDGAIKAANAYTDIVTAIGNASNAAEDAIKAGEVATSKANNIVGDSEGVRRTNDELLLKIHNLEETVRADDGPAKQLQAIRDDLNHVKSMNHHVNNTLNQVLRGIQNIPQLQLEGVYDSASLDTVTEAARSALNKINENAADIPQQLTTVKQLHKDNQQAIDNVHVANKELEKVNNILPDMVGLVEQLKEKPQEMKKMAETIKDDLEDLKQKVRMARDIANRIKVGATFFRNTTLELRNPESISHQGLNSHISVYFRTTEPNGLILYLGNEKGTSRKMRRSNSDDFMALQLENGYPVLTIDLGSGPEQINNNKYVSNDRWYQAVVDRTGKSVQFKIREEVTPEDVKEHSVESVLKGQNTLLNLDKEHSKLFVGGFPVTFDVQPSLKYTSFEGRIEELVVGDSQVGLWNFEDAANLNEGSAEREELLNVSLNTGYRFNGEGFVIINGKDYGMKKRSDIKMSFKTFADDGLLFLTHGGKSRSRRDAGDNHMMSIEMRGGRIIYQYNVGTEQVVLQTDDTYNDGQWHSVSATRLGLAGILEVDKRQDRAKQYRPAGGATDGDLLLVQKTFYFGGTPREVSVEGVTNIGFDGCIDEVQVGQTSIDLSSNANAYGVTPGCPVKFAGVISFEEGARGYARWGNATARDNIVQLILKIKTTNPNGLIAYAVDGSASASLQLVDGNVVFKSGGQEVTTSAATKYNDGQWHVIVATSQTGEPLLLDIDDYDNFKSPDTAIAMRLLYSNLYFGGVPSRVDAALALQPQFSGCIGDATLNGVVVNFANLTDTSQAVVGKCLWDEEAKPPFSVARGRPELPISGEFPGPDDGSPRTPEAEEDLSPEEPPEEVSDSPTLVDRFEPPPPTTMEPPTPAPTPVPNCKLPLYPATDPAVTALSGVRFGTKFGSRVEYDPLPGRLRNKFDFSVSIKTVSTEGIILYVHDPKHIDFIALYLKDGRVHYGYNCGSGAALLESDNPVNDGEWHSVRFSRVQTAGKLFIDDLLVAEGESKGSTKTINVNPPIYLGGIAPSISDNTKTNLKGLNNTFEGCLKNFTLNNGHVTTASKPIGVIPCSDNVEVGAYFSPEGGYIKFSDKFRVGLEIDIKLEIKPRDLNGMLVSVHSKRDYLLLQMVNGTIRFSVDNGKGEISAAYTPPTPHYFCDGVWHNIQAVKSKNVVSLSVDKIFAEPGIGISSSTDTKHPLYIGGHPSKSKTLRGLQAAGQYVGCIRNLEINGRQEALNRLPTFGNVTQSVCPTI